MKRNVAAAAAATAAASELVAAQAPTSSSRPSQIHAGRSLAVCRPMWAAILGLVFLAIPLAGAQNRAATAGVRLEVRPGVAHPRPLSRPLVALFVVIENGGTQDLQMDPVPFSLTTPGGREYRPIGPDALRRSPESSPFVEPAIALSALPRDVLNRGARTEGFIYFEEIHEPAPWRLTLALRAPSAAQQSGVVSVTFHPERK